MTRVAEPDLDPLEVEPIGLSPTGRTDANLLTRLLVAALAALIVTSVTVLWQRDRERRTADDVVASGVAGRHVPEVESEISVPAASVPPTTLSEQVPLLTPERTQPAVRVPPGAAPEVAPPPVTTAPAVPSSDAVLSARADGGVGNSDSKWPSASTDGNLVAFVSRASDLVDGDTNAAPDVFIREVPARHTRRVTGLGGAELNGASYWVALSGDGRTLVFVSEATNAVEGDGNGFADLFALDVASGAVRRVFEARDASLAMPAVSADGTTLAFATRDGVFVQSTGGGASLVAPGGQWPSLSADGRFVSFTTAMRGLAPGDDVSNQDVYVLDRASGRTEVASVGADGSQPNAGSFSGPRALSADGRRVAFVSVARLTPGDTNHDADVYVRDLAAGTTRLVPQAGRGASGNASYPPSISTDGRLIAFNRPDAAPNGLTWDLSTNRVAAITGSGGPSKLPLEGLSITARGYLASTPEGALVGQERWRANQIILLR